MFTEIPAVVYGLKGLQRLDLSRNNRLTRIEDEILQLINLESLRCEDSRSLVYPPYAVSELGLKSIQKYLHGGTSKASLPLEKTLPTKEIVFTSIFSGRC